MLCCCGAQRYAYGALAGDFLVPFASALFHLDSSLEASPDPFLDPALDPSLAEPRQFPAFGADSIASQGVSLSSSPLMSDPQSSPPDLKKASSTRAQTPRGWWGYLDDDQIARRSRIFGTGSGSDFAISNIPREDNTRSSKSNSRSDVGTDAGAGQVESLAHDATGGGGDGSQQRCVIEWVHISPPSTPSPPPTSTSRLPNRMLKSTLKVMNTDTSGTTTRDGLDLVDDNSAVGGGSGGWAGDLAGAEEAMAASLNALGWTKVGVRIQARALFQALTSNPLPGSSLSMYFRATSSPIHISRFTVRVRIRVMVRVKLRILV
jgi:hypothetical protein